MFRIDPGVQTRSGCSYRIRLFRQDPVVQPDPGVQTRSGCSDQIRVFDQILMFRPWNRRFLMFFWEYLWNQNCYSKYYNTYGKKIEYIFNGPKGQQQQKHQNSRRRKKTPNKFIDIIKIANLFMYMFNVYVFILFLSQFWQQWRSFWIMCT